MAYVYILKTSSGRYYIGSTDKLEQRLKNHFQGKVSATKSQLPVTLVFKEFYSTRGEAQRKEYKIKRWKSREMVERLIQLGPYIDST